MDQLIQVADHKELDSEVLPELTVKVFERGGGRKNYVLRDVQVGTISSNKGFKDLVVHEFGTEVCGPAKDFQIRYLKGNKRVWIRTDKDYSEILQKLYNRSALR